MPRSRLAWLTAQRRRSGLRSFPRAWPSTPPYPGSTLLPAASASRSPAPAPSAAGPGPPANRHTLYATGSRSAHLTRLWRRLSVRHGYFDLPQKGHYLFRTMLLASRHLPLLLFQFVSPPLAQIEPGTPPGEW